MFASCSKESKNDALKNHTITAKGNKSGFDYFEYDKEKIVLLSLSKNISQKRVLTILTEYYDKTVLILNDSETPEYFTKIIDTIAKNNRMSNQKVASIIFSFKYELVTDDEVIEDYESDRVDYISEQSDYENDY